MALSFIKKLILALLSVVGTVSFLTFISSIDFFNTGQSQQNLQATVGEIQQAAIPPEVSFIDKAINTIQNPFVLVLVIVFIIWLFWPESKKKVKYVYR